MGKKKEKECFRPLSQIKPYTAFSILGQRSLFIRIPVSKRKHKTLGLKGKPNGAIVCRIDGLGEALVSAVPTVLKKAHCTSLRVFPSDMSKEGMSSKLPRHVELRVKGVRPQDFYYQFVKARRRKRRHWM